MVGESDSKAVFAYLDDVGDARVSKLSLHILLSEREGLARRVGLDTAHKVGLPSCQLTHQLSQRILELE